MLLLPDDGASLTEDLARTTLPRAKGLFEESEGLAGPKPLPGAFSLLSLAARTEPDEPREPTGLERLC